MKAEYFKNIFALYGFYIVGLFILNILILLSVVLCGRNSFLGWVFYPSNSIIQIDVSYLFSCVFSWIAAGILSAFNVWSLKYFPLQSVNFRHMTMRETWVETGKCVLLSRIFILLIICVNYASNYENIFDMGHGIKEKVTPRTFFSVFMISLLQIYLYCLLLLPIGWNIVFIAVENVSIGLRISYYKQFTTGELVCVITVLIIMDLAAILTNCLLRSTTLTWFSLKELYLKLSNEKQEMLDILSAETKAPLQRLSVLTERVCVKDLLQEQGFQISHRLMRGIQCINVISIDAKLLMEIEENSVGVKLLEELKMRALFTSLLKQHISATLWQDNKDLSLTLDISEEVDKLDLRYDSNLITMLLQNVLFASVNELLVADERINSAQGGADGSVSSKIKFAPHLAISISLADTKVGLETLVSKIGDVSRCLPENVVALRHVVCSLSFSAVSDDINENMNIFTRVCSRVSRVLGGTMKIHSEKLLDFNTSSVDSYTGLNAESLKLAKLTVSFACCEIDSLTGRKYDSSVSDSLKGSPRKLSDAHTRSSKKEDLPSPTGSRKNSVTNGISAKAIANPEIGSIISGLEVDIGIVSEDGQGKRSMLPVFKLLMEANIRYQLLRLDAIDISSCDKYLFLLSCSSNTCIGLRQKGFSGFLVYFISSSIPMNVEVAGLCDSVLHHPCSAVDVSNLKYRALKRFASTCKDPTHRYYVASSAFTGPLSRGNSMSSENSIARLLSRRSSRDSADGSTSFDYSVTSKVVPILSVIKKYLFERPAKSENALPMFAECSSRVDEATFPSLLPLSLGVRYGFVGMVLGIPMFEWEIEQEYYQWLIVTEISINWCAKKKVIASDAISHEDKELTLQAEVTDNLPFLGVSVWLKCLWLVYIVFSVSIFSFNQTSSLCGLILCGLKLLVLVPGTLLSSVLKKLHISISLMWFLIGCIVLFVQIYFVGQSLYVYSGIEGWSTEGESQRVNGSILAIVLYTRHFEEECYSYLSVCKEILDHCLMWSMMFPWPIPFFLGLMFIIRVVLLSIFTFDYLPPGIYESVVAMMVLSLCLYFTFMFVAEQALRRHFQAMHKYEFGKKFVSELNYLCAKELNIPTLSILAGGRQLLEHLRVAIMNERFLFTESLLNDSTLFHIGYLQVRMLAEEVKLKLLEASDSFDIQNISSFNKDVVWLENELYHLTSAFDGMGGDPIEIYLHVDQSLSIIRTDRTALGTIIVAAVSFAYDNVKRLFLVDPSTSREVQEVIIRVYSVKSNAAGKAGAAFTEQRHFCIEVIDSGLPHSDNPKISIPNFRKNSSDISNVHNMREFSFGEHVCRHFSRGGFHLKGFNYETSNIQHFKYRNMQKITFPYFIHPRASSVSSMLTGKEGLIRSCRDQVFLLSAFKHGKLLMKRALLISLSSAQGGFHLNGNILQRAGWECTVSSDVGKVHLMKGLMECSLVLIDSSVFTVLSSYSASTVISALRASGYELAIVCLLQAEDEVLVGREFFDDVVVKPLHLNMDRLLAIVTRRFIGHILWMNED